MNLMNALRRMRLVHDIKGPEPDDEEMCGKDARSDIRILSVDRVSALEVPKKSPLYPIIRGLLWNYPFLVFKHSKKSKKYFGKSGGVYDYDYIKRMFDVIKSVEQELKAQNEYILYTRIFSKDEYPLIVELIGSEMKVLARIAIAPRVENY